MLVRLSDIKTSKYVRVTRCNIIQLDNQVDQQRYTKSRERWRTENRIYAAIIFGVVRDLGIFSENNFTTRGYHAQLGDIDFYDRSLRHDAKLGVHRRLRVFLDTKNL